MVVAGGSGHVGAFLSVYICVSVSIVLCVLCRINPVTGIVEDEQPNPMEGMTEEQKEMEAMKLVNMFDKLSR